MLKKVIAVGVSFGLITSLMAKPNIKKPENFRAKIEKIAGKPGPFIQGKEFFPKDYFLVPKNLPHLIGPALHHPQSSTLNLSKEQIQKVANIKKSIMPSILKKAKKIKDLELKLAQNILIEDKSPKSQYPLVEEIAKLRAELTKIHLKCINDIKKILTKEQFKKLLDLATNKGDKR